MLGRRRLTYLQSAGNGSAVDGLLLLDDLKRFVLAGGQVHRLRS